MPRILAKEAVMTKFKIGERISWMAANGECSGVVMVHDDYNLGYMVARLNNGRRMIVHESSARKCETIVA